MERSKRRARAIAIAKSDDSQHQQARLLTIAAVSLAVVAAFAAFQLI